MSRKRWTTAQLCALYERAIDDTLPVSDMEVVARDTRRAIEAPTLADAVAILNAEGWGAPDWCAQQLRFVASLDDPGKCPTCGQERKP